MHGSVRVNVYYSIYSVITHVRSILCVHILRDVYYILRSVCIIYCVICCGYAVHVLRCAVYVLRVTACAVDMCAAGYIQRCVYCSAGYFPRC